MEESDLTALEEGDSTSRVIPYELATLASRINPERCASAPKEAIAAAEVLLQEAELAISDAYQEKCQKAWDQEIARAPRIKWTEGLKRITGQKRRDRAEKRFLEFIEHIWPVRWKQSVNHFMRDGFTEEEDIYHLKRYFTDWLNKPKRKKGKQGRRISKSDGRLRTELVRLVPRKPRQPA